MKRASFPPEVVSFDDESATATLSDGQVIPITDWLFGEHETPTPLGADRAVAGPDREGRWYSFCFERIEGGNA
jgi:hypothetical protein